MKSLQQHHIVTILAIGLAVVFSVVSPDFLKVDNVLSLLRNVSVLGILAMAMALVVIGRGIDLAMVAIMVISSAFFINLYNAGYHPTVAALAGLGFAVLVGVLQGTLIAYAEVPAIFTTLAAGVGIYGFGQYFLVPQDVSHLPQSAEAFRNFGSFSLFGIPVQIFVVAVVAVGFQLFFRFTKYGWFIYAMGDNPAGARLAGVSVRLMAVFKYALAAAMAYGAGMLVVSTVSSMSLRIINSTMIYDIILVVVLGGIGLSGGKGGILNVLSGTILVGILLNGMTLLNVTYTSQSIVKGCILLIALMIDAYVNPRDEQTEKQGDI